MITPHAGHESPISAFDGYAFLPREFSGTARLFPVPGLVMFPHVMQPLHVFEPRYRAMVEDALAGDRLITMGVLVPGWERDYEGRPPVWPVGCLGRVVISHRLEGGAYNMLLMALRRVRLVRELPTRSSSPVCSTRSMARPPSAARWWMCFRSMPSTPFG